MPCSILLLDRHVLDELHCEIETKGNSFFRSKIDGVICARKRRMMDANSVQPCHTNTETSAEFHKSYQRLVK